jgi:signal peptidase I
MSWRQRQKRERGPALIVRFAERCGWRPTQGVREALEWVEVLAIAAALAAVIMTFVTVRMHVPTKSMVPTINPGDSFFVDRITYYFRDPKPGDIVVFRHTDQVFVGRVIPGSRAARAGVPADAQLVSLNAERVHTTAFIDQRLESWADGTALSLVTADGKHYDLGQKGPNARTLKDLGLVTREQRMRYVKRLIAVGGQTVQIRDGAVYVDGKKLEGPRFARFYYSSDSQYRFGVSPTTVPEGSYFVLGDNSGESYDSRYWGFVDEKDLIGVPYLRVWPIARFGPM